jgi:thiol-disulfide isomerase/thioredoxin
MRGPVSKTFTIRTAEAAPPALQLRITMTVEPYVTILPPAGAAFGRVRAGQTQTRIVELGANTGTPLTLSLLPPTETSPFHGELVEAEPGKRYQLKVTCTAPTAPQSYRRTLRLRTNIPQRPEILVPCTLEVPPRLEVMPRQIAVPDRQGATFVMTFRNNGDEPVAVNSAKATDPAIRTTVQRISEVQYSILVAIPAGFTPRGTGCIVEIKTTDAQEPLIRVPILAAGQSAPSAIAASRPAQAPDPQLIGKPAPRVALNMLAGAPLTTGAPGADVVVLLFWRQGCPHCQRIIPKVTSVAQGYHGEPVRFIGVNQDVLLPPNQVQQFAAQLGLASELAQDDAKKNAARAYGFSGLPTLVVLAPDGIVAAVYRGNRDGIESVLAAEIDRLLGTATGQHSVTRPAAVGSAK